MAAPMLIFEKFVECPGIVEIKYTSDDPTFYKPPEDLFDVQDGGVPVDLGKKDKSNTEQTMFWCKLCECDLKAVKTLKAHKKGTQHQRKVYARVREYKMEQQRKTAGGQQVEQRGRSKSPDNEVTTPLKQLIEGGKGIIGLEFVEEYVMPGNDRQPAYYYCRLAGCKNFYGISSRMKNHVSHWQHQKSYLEEKYGENPDLNNVARIRAEATAEESAAGTGELKDPISDLAMYHRVKAGRMIIDHSPPRRRRSPSPPRLRSPSPPRRRRSYRSPSPPRRTKSPYQRRRSSPSVKEEMRERSRSPVHLNQETREQHWHSLGAGVPVSRRTSSSSEVEITNEVLRTARNLIFHSKPEPRVDESIVDPSELNQAQEPQQPAVSSTGTNPIQDFHTQVTECVKRCLNVYFFPKYDGYVKKIADNSDYAQLCKEFSHSIRKEEKESAEARGELLESLTVNPDMRNRIKLQVDRFFENRPVLP